MEDRWRPYINVVRGSLALPGVVVLWTGLWTFLDRHVAGGLSVWKELGLSVLGAMLMVWTRTLFSNAGMDSLDHNGSLAEMSSLLAEGRLDWISKAAFYGRSMIAIAASIMFWDGVYTICNDHGWPNTPMYNAICALVGGMGMVWVVTTSEDDDAETGGGWGWGWNSDVVGSADVLGEVRAGRMEASQTPREGWIQSNEAKVFDELDVMAKAGLYGKALFCNISTVVCWKGVEEGIEAGPDTNWTGLIFFVIGLSILACTKRLATNVGLDDEHVELSAVNSFSASRSASAMRKLKKASRTSLQGSRSSLMSSSFDGVSGGGRRRDDKPWSFGVEKRSDDGDDEEEHTSEWDEDESRQCRCPRWVMTAAELVGVVFAWTGVEWYIWDGDYIPDTWIRDLAYIVVGVMALLVTGTFFNLAGMISPMAVLKRVHAHNRHDEMVPLLSSPRSAASNEEHAWLKSPRHSPGGLGSITR